MAHHYQEFAPSYEQLPRFHIPNTWGDFFMTGGEIVMTRAYSSLYIRRGRVCFSCKKSPGETFACKIRHGADFSRENSAGRRRFRGENL